MDEHQETDEDSQRKNIEEFLSVLEDREKSQNGTTSSKYNWEFLKIRAANEDVRELPEFSCSEASKECNIVKNRYRDIVPYNFSRVTLGPCEGFEDDGDYINASFINGVNGRVAYIAAQGPVPDSVKDFWRMIAQYSIEVIVMLCKVEEQGRKKCEQYWPSTTSECLKYDSVTVSLLNESKINSGLVVRDLELCRPCKSSEQHPVIRRVVKQVHFLDWPDHGAPDTVEEVMDLLEHIRHYQSYDRVPLLLHCSAGCGRTGSICALDYTRSLLRSGRLKKDKFNLLNIVTELRRQRPVMVQTLDQYVLLHRAVANLFRKHLSMMDSHIYQNLPLKTSPTPSDDSGPEEESTGTPPNEEISEESELSESEERGGKHSPKDKKSAPDNSAPSQDNQSPKVDKEEINSSCVIHPPVNSDSMVEWKKLAGITVPSYPHHPSETPKGPKGFPDRWTEANESFEEQKVMRL